MVCFSRFSIWFKSDDMIFKQFLLEYIYISLLAIFFLLIVCLPRFLVSGSSDNYSTVFVVNHSTPIYVFMVESPTCGNSKSSSRPPGSYCHPRWWQETLTYIGEKESVPLCTDLKPRDTSKRRQFVQRNSFETDGKLVQLVLKLATSYVDQWTDTISLDFHYFREMLMLGL